MKPLHEVHGRAGCPAWPQPYEPHQCPSPALSPAAPRRGRGRRHGDLHAGTAACRHGVTSHRPPAAAQAPPAHPQRPAGAHPGAGSLQPQHHRLDGGSRHPSPGLGQGPGGSWVTQGYSSPCACICWWGPAEPSGGFAQTLLVADTAGAVPAGAR